MNYNYRKYKYPKNLLIDILGDEADSLLNADDDFINEDNKQGLQYVLKHLSDREQQILEDRFIYQMTLEAIGKRHDVTKTRIREILAKALRKLIHPTRRKYILKGFEVYKKELKVAAEERQRSKEQHRQYMERMGYIQGCDICELSLSVRAYNCLKRAGYNTIEQVAELTEQELLSIRNMGKKAANEVWEKIRLFYGDLK